MAKPINRRVAVRSSDTVVGAEVHARGAHQTGPSKSVLNAQTLSSALGLAGQVSLQRTEKQVAAGALAAQQGDVDIDTLRAQEKSGAWVKGAEQIIGRARAIEDEAAMQEWYATEFDKDKDITVLRTELNAWQKDRYEGIDPGIAKEVAPYLSRGANALMKAHGASETAEGVAMVQNGLATSTNEWLSRPAAERTAEEWKSQREEYTSMYPTREQGLQALASNMANAAILGKSELDLAENPMFEQMRTNPATRDIVSEGIKEAKRIRVKDYMENTKVQRALVEAEADSLIASGDFDSAMAFIAAESSAREDGNPPNLTEGEVDALVGKMYGVSSKQVLTPLMVQHMDEGNVYAIPSKWGDAAFDAWYGQAQEKYDPADLGQRVVQRVVNAGWMPTRLKDMMEMANPGNPELMGEAHAMYTAFEADYPGALAGGLISERALEEIEAYDQLSQDYPAERVVELMRGEHNPATYNQWTAEEKRTAQTDALSEVADVNWSWTELQENPLLKAKVDKRMRYFAGFGMTPEKAAEMAVKDIDSKHQVLGGELFDSASPWGAKGEEVIDYILDQEEYEGSKIVPVPGEPNYAIIKDEDSMFAAGTRVRVADLVSQFDSNEERLLNEAAAQRNARVRESHKEEAIDRMFPGMGRAVFAEPGQAQLDLRDRRQAAWDSKTEAEKDAVFTQIAAEEAAEAESRRAAATRITNNPNFAKAL